MNRNDDFDRQLTAWLRLEAPPQAPDWVLASALQRVAAESQRRGWLASLRRGSRMGLILRVAVVGAVVAVAAFVGLQLSHRAPDVGGPTPSPSSSSPPSPTASGTPTATPVVLAPDNVLPAYSLVNVLQGLELRGRPGTGGAVVTTIAPGQVVYVLSGEFGPVMVGGVTYYHVEYAPNFAGWPNSVDGAFEGWVPSERDGVPLVEIAPVVCPVEAPGPPSLAGMTAWARLSCFGPRELVLEGSWVSGAGGIWPWEGSPSWLVPPDVERAISDAGGQFSFVLAPNVVVPPPLKAGGGSVRITGHFDDPAAATCVIRAGEPIVEQPAASVELFCRERFVVTSLELLKAI